MKIIGYLTMDESVSFVIAKRLKELREAAGLSHNKLSQAIEKQYGVTVSPDSLKNYEVAVANRTHAYANRGMSVKYLLCFADFYGVSADYLLGRTDVKSPNVDIRTICNYTGLSDEAVRVLHYYYSPSEIASVRIHFDRYPDILSRLLELEEFQEVLHLIREAETIKILEKSKGMNPDEDSDLPQEKTGADLQAAESLFLELGRTWISFHESAEYSAQKATQLFQRIIRTLAEIEPYTPVKTVVESEEFQRYIARGGE